LIQVPPVAPSRSLPSALPLLIHSVGFLNPNCSHFELMAGGPTKPLRSGILIPMNSSCKPRFAVISGLFGPDVSINLSRLARLGDFVANLFAPAPLHGRCISSAVRCHSPSPGGKTGDSEKSETPCGDRGFRVDRRHLANGGKVEAAGIEPASCDSSAEASTCVFG
jgi:hypothetical protein